MCWIFPYTIPVLCPFFTTFICPWLQGKTGWFCSWDWCSRSWFFLTSFWHVSEGFLTQQTGGWNIKQSVSHREACWAIANATSTYSIYISWSWMNEWLAFLYIASFCREGDFLITNRSKVRRRGNKVTATIGHGSIFLNFFQKQEVPAPSWCRRC